MRAKSKLASAIFFIPFLFGGIMNSHWIIQKYTGYDIYYTSPDSENIRDYNELVRNGIKSTTSFFNSAYKNSFDVFIYPNRKSLDSTWQKDWQMPDFKSECWMVASGVANKLDIISPKVWNEQACEHVYAETQKTQELVTHELVHVFHGQINVSPDFSNTEGIDWFVEGLATYASGQCDSLRITEVQKAIADNKIPNGLDSFWTGNLKYGLSGTVVMYIDSKYGRPKLKSLLPFNKKSEILEALEMTEAELLRGWKTYMQNYLTPKTDGQK